MGRKVDVDDLIDTATVAELLGFTNRRSLSAHRARHLDFPAPVVASDAGRCLLWLRQDVIKWMRSRGHTQR